MKRFLPRAVLLGVAIAYLIVCAVLTVAHDRVWFWPLLAGGVTVGAVVVFRRSSPAPAPAPADDDHDIADSLMRLGQALEHDDPTPDDASRDVRELEHWLSLPQTLAGKPAVLPRQRNGHNRWGCR